MKKILITGRGSYLGISFENWLRKWPDQYHICTAGTINDEWKFLDFNGYDAVFHVAGIAHVSIDPKMEDLYYKVNRDLAIDIAKKAKSAGVKQFIFMSSMIIYGDDGRIGEKKIITRNTLPQPTNFYGKSKLEADLEIQKMADDQFKSVIVRTPMVYGPGCKGNFPKLMKLAKICPVFPDVENERSMIFIDNLCEFIRKCIDNNVCGVFFPQNKEYVCTKRVIMETAESMKRRIYLFKWFNPLLYFLSNKVGYINKIFGNKVYDTVISTYDFGEYNVCDFPQSIKRYLSR